MKKITGIAIIPITGIIIIFALPYIINKIIPSSNLTKLAEVEYTSSVYANGSLAEKNKSELKLDVPVVPQEVKVSIGDTVNIGDLIALVDKQQTINAIQKISADSSYDSEDIFSVMAGSALDKSVLTDSDDIMEMIPGKIIAMSTGIVTGIGISQGELAMAGLPLATISNLDEILVNLAVNEVNISEISVGQEMVITGVGFKDREYKAYITKINPTARKQLNGLSTETVVDVEAEIMNPDEYLKPGFSVKCEIYTNKGINIGIVPYESIWQDDEGVEYVYVYENGRAVKRRVVTGVELRNGVQIKEGLDFESYILSDASKAGEDGYVRITGVN